MQDDTRLRRPIEGFAVQDPTLRPGRRRYFTQTADGAGHRAFTAAGAARKARRAGPPSVLARLAARWQAACERETERRGRCWI